MAQWQRRIRGAIGMGMFWALAWFLAGMALLLVVGPDAADVPFPLGFAFLGFIAGALFSAVLTVAEARRNIDQTSLLRFALWGGVGGLILAGGFSLAAGLLGELVVLAPVFAIAGASSAAGALALARRGPTRTLSPGE